MDEDNQPIHIKMVDFKKIFEKYFPSLCIFANKIVQNDATAKDVVQDVFYKVWKSSPTFQNEKTIKAYLYLATKNTSLDYLKVKDNNNLKYIDHYNERALSNYDISLEFVREETYRLLDEAIQKLPPKRRKIIQLYLKGYSNKEIAEHLNVSINTVKTQKIIAYRKIRIYVDSHVLMMLMMNAPVFA